MASRIVEKADEKFILLVSIPGNDPELARAAEEGGADGIKVHLNVYHHASGTKFGTWNEEKESVKKILQEVKIPVGVLPGAEKIAKKDEILEAKKMGVDFLDSFAHHMPVELMKIGNLGIMLAVNRDYTPGQVSALEEMGMDLLEATVLPREEYGKRLNARDLAIYYQLAKWTGRPVVVPTQKKIIPEEVLDLKKAGARGIVIGAVVTGMTAEGIYKTTTRFRREIDRI